MSQTSHRSRTAKGEPMLFLTLEDLSGMLDVVFFPNAYRQAKNVVSSSIPFLVSGTMEMDVSGGRTAVKSGEGCCAGLAPIISPIYADSACQYSIDEFRRILATTTLYPPPRDSISPHKMAGSFPYSSQVCSSMASILANRWINLYAIKVYSRSEPVRIQNFIGVFLAFGLLPAVFSPFGLVAAEYAPQNFELSGGNYTVMNKSGDWLVCGYSKQ